MKSIILFFALAIFVWEIFFKWPDDFLHVTTCDVGQGDAILLSLGFIQALIDTGPDESVLSCLDKQMPFWDKNIDVLVITHFDEDHIGGFQQLTQVYSINYLFLPLTNYKDSKTFLELKEQISAMQKFGTIVKEPFLGQQIVFSEFRLTYQAKYNSTNSSLSLTFLTPTDLDLKEYKSLEATKALFWQAPEHELSDEDWQKLAIKKSDNNGSIVIIANFGEVKILLLGDLESTREVALLDDGLITRVDIQKVGHHGSKTSSSIELIHKSKPEISLISCGLNNQFGHPNEEVLENLESIASQVLRTDQLGTIEIVSDGQEFWLKNKKQNLF
jgi:competence protein ComEC